MSFKLPAYLEEIEDPKDRETAKCRFLLRYAALLFSPSGRLKVLSAALDLHESSLAGLSAISPELAVRIETLIGRDYIARETLNPIFANQE